VSLLTVRPAFAQQFARRARDPRTVSGRRRRIRRFPLDSVAPIRRPYAVIQLNRTALNALLALAPNENDANRAASRSWYPCHCRRRFSRFRIEESPILSPELAAAFPDIKNLQRVEPRRSDRPARLDITPPGFTRSSRRRRHRLR